MPVHTVVHCAGDNAGAHGHELVVAGDEDPFRHVSNQCSVLGDGNIPASLERHRCLYLGIKEAGHGRRPHTNEQKAYRYSFIEEKNAFARKEAIARQMGTDSATNALSRIPSDWNAGRLPWRGQNSESLPTACQST